MIEADFAFHKFAGLWYEQTTQPQQVQINSAEWDEDMCCQFLLEHYSVGILVTIYSKPQICISLIRWIEQIESDPI